MDKLTAAHIDAYMGKTGFVCILEEYDITGLQFGFGNLCALLVHGGQRSAGLDTQGVQHIVNKTGAVEAAGGCATPFVGDTQILLGQCNDLITGHSDPCTPIFLISHPDPEVNLKEAFDNYHIKVSTGAVFVGLDKNSVRLRVPLEKDRQAVLDAIEAIDKKF